MFGYLYYWRRERDTAALRLTYLATQMLSHFGTRLRTCYAKNDYQSFLSLRLLKHSRICHLGTLGVLCSLFLRIQFSLRLGHAQGKTTLSCFLTPSRRFATLKTIINRFYLFTSSIMNASRVSPSRMSLNFSIPTPHS